MAMYIEMFSWAEPESMQLALTQGATPTAGQTTPAGQPTQTEAGQMLDSARQTPAEAEVDILAQQATMEIVFGSLKEKL